MWRFLYKVNLYIHQLYCTVLFFIAFNFYVKSIDFREYLNIDLQEENKKIYKSKKCDLKGAEATCMELASEMKKCFRLKDMLNFNVL